MSDLSSAFPYQQSTFGQDISRRLAHLPGIRDFNNLNIGIKLNIGFSILILLIFLVVGLIFVGSQDATRNINLTEDVHVPAVLASSQAQSSLLKMQNSVRGYLVLGDLQNIDDYNKAKETFEINLAELETLSANWTDESDIRRLNELKLIFDAWSPLPERLFELHDNPLANQPALRIESLEFQPLNYSRIWSITELRFRQ